MNYESKERDMNKQLDASFSWKSSGGSDNSVAGNLEFGRKNGTTVLTEGKFESVYYTVKTTGGAYNLTVSTPVASVEGNMIDLSPWVTSLNEVSTHTLIGIVDEGLSPISDFILEENFMQRIQDTHLGYSSNQHLGEPFIEIAKVYVRSTSSAEKLYEIAPILNTRQGDKIILRDGLASSASDAELRANNDYTTFMAKAQTIAYDKGRYFSCLITAKPTLIINPLLRIPLCFDFKQVDESRMYKYKNPQTNMWYIYDTVSRVAFSYYLDDYILNAYGIYDWVISLPERSISMSSLYQLYRIIGL